MHNFTHLYKMDLSHRAIAVYIYLADRANKDGICWPAIPTISRELKISESTTRRALKDLREAGLLKSIQRYRENGGIAVSISKLSVNTETNRKREAMRLHCLP